MKSNNNDRVQRLWGRIGSTPALRLLPLVVVVFAAPGRSQSAFKFAHGDWEISAFGGGSFIGDSMHSTPVEGTSSSRSVGLSYGAGSQLGIRVSDTGWQHWGTTLEYSFSNQPMTLTNLSDSLPSLGIGHAIHRFVYDVEYYPFDREEQLRPFVFAGPGVSLFYVKSQGKDAAAAHGIRLTDPWKFTMSWGGGVKYVFRRQCATSLQFSDSISGVPRYGLPMEGRFESGTYIPGFRPNGLQHNWLIGIGFVYQWDDN